MQLSSLNVAINRIQSIEQRFNALEGFSQIKKPDKDFETILNSSINKIEKETETDIRKNNLTNSNNVSRNEIQDLIEKYAIKNNLDKDFVKAVIKQESGFKTNATSHCGAMGLMQLMPKTAMSLGVENAYDAEQNIAGGTKYLKNLLSQYNGNKEYALAAYNAGPTAVNKYGGIPPYKETQNYVKNVISNYNSYKKDGF